MIVLPNSFERYMSALRIFVSLSILKHGLQPRHLEKLKKIYYAEALFHKNLLGSVDINKLCNNLLGAVRSLNPDFKFYCHTHENYILNKKLFTCLLLTAAKTGNINVLSHGNFLKIKFSGESEPLSPFVSALGGFLLHERTTTQGIAVIPVTLTAQESVYIESEWEYLFDKFSAVNLFFN